MQILCFGLLVGVPVLKENFVEPLFLCVTACFNYCFLFERRSQFEITFYLCVLLQSFQLLSVFLVFVPSVLLGEARIRIFPPLMFFYHIGKAFSVKVKIPPTAPCSTLRSEFQRYSVENSFQMGSQRIKTVMITARSFK